MRGRVRDATPLRRSRAVGALAVAGATSNAPDALVLRQIVGIFAADASRLQALQGIDLLRLRTPTDRVVGASGSGQVDAAENLVDWPSRTAGKVRVAGRRSRRSGARMARLSRHTVGFISQQTATKT